MQKSRDMKKIKLFVIFTLLAIRAFAPKPPPEFTMVRPEAISPYEKIWLAVCKTESDNNPLAVNMNDPNGGSFGIAQIGRLKLSEYNTANKANYKLTDCFGVELSKKIFYWHCMRYPDIETAVKAWNGSGSAVVVYWNKILATCVLF